jgi:1-acyl-sn-glycerol-3-phosphate acyltransferase
LKAPALGIARIRSGIGRLLVASLTGRRDSTLSRIGIGARHLREYWALIMGYAVLGVGCVLVSLVSFPLTLVVRERPAAWLGRRLATYGFRAYLFWLVVSGVARFDIKALDALRNAGPLIIAANHPGLLDAPMILSRLPNIVCVLKASLLRNFLWGAGSRLARYIPNDWFLGSVSLAIDELHKGSQLLLFPEGTRTESGPLNEFRAGVAYVSYRSGAPIQTVFIEQNSNFLGKRYPFLKRPDMPVRYRIRLGRRFDPPSDPRAFTQALRDYFLEQLT